jgi:hypothetical protein
VRFLDALAQKGSVRAACAVAGVSANTAYKARRRDTLFAAAWGAALVLARDHVADVLGCRALDGVEEPVFYHGEEVARRVRFDSRLLLAHLARLDKAAEETLAGEHPRRFDELAAMVGGASPADDMVETLGWDEEDEPGRVALPHSRAAHVERAERREARRLLAGDADDADMLDAFAAARDGAGAQWDAWFDAACAVVDGAVLRDGPSTSSVPPRDGRLECYRHPRENGELSPGGADTSGIPAFAGMTNEGVGVAAGGGEGEQERDKSTCPPIEYKSLDGPGICAPCTVSPLSPPGACEGSGAGGRGAVGAGHHDWSLPPVPARRAASRRDLRRRQGPPSAQPDAGGDTLGRGGAAGAGRSGRVRCLLRRGRARCRAAVLRTRCR